LLAAILRLRAFSQQPCCAVEASNFRCKTLL
jgi:hypothetical protein